MKLQIWLFSGIVMVLFLSCGPKVIIPPEIDLTKYEHIGLIGFSCNAEGNMDEFVTRWFLMTIRAYQKGTHIIELGDEKDILKCVQADQIDTESIRAIGRKYNVNRIFTGKVEITEVQPLLVLYPGGPRPMSGETQVEGRRVKALVKVWITARLWETEQGGTVWRRSDRGEDMVDQVSVLSGGKIVFDARDPRKAFWDLVNPLVKKLCTDFKTKSVRIQEYHQ
jgi:hypothetical protein